MGYFLKVSEQLKGELDYFLRTQTQFLVIEAKNADLQRGFTQLGVELIAVEQAEFASYSQDLRNGTNCCGNILKITNFAPYYSCPA